jgi:glycosyltransferase involved in cell wall biosynthesis
MSPSIVKGNELRMPRILSVATAGTRTEQLVDINRSRFPRVDYLELQRLFDVDTMDYSAYNRTYIGEYLRRIETQLRSDLYLATISWLKGRNYPLVFTWSERAGIPFAAYKKHLRSSNRFVTMFQSWSDRQELFITQLGLFSAMDEVIVHCESMRRNLVDIGAPEERVKIIHYSVDQAFFSPVPQVEPQKKLILSVGESRSRDYPALFRAVDGLPVTLEVAASGHWYAREKNNRIGSSIPENVSLIRHVPQIELRNLYANALFVVLPVRDLVYSAGATASLEAGGMGRAVIAFRSRGIVDYIIDGETGILVEPGDVTAMRDAIQYLLANPQEARRLGENARQRIVEEQNLEAYVCSIANLLAENLAHTA